MHTTPSGSPVQIVSGQCLCPWKEKVVRGGGRCARFSVFTNLGKLPNFVPAVVPHADSKRQRHMLDPVHIFRHCHEAGYALLDCPLASSCHKYPCKGVRDSEEACTLRVQIAARST